MRQIASREPGGGLTDSKFRVLKGDLTVSDAVSQKIGEPQDTVPSDRLKHRIAHEHSTVLQ